MWRLQVLSDGRRVNSCPVLAVMADGSAVVTVEGLAENGSAALQAAFIDRDALQCGYCTPGQLCSAAGMLREAADGWPSAVSTDGDGSVVLDGDEVRERLSGNLCRCGAYVNIVAAVLDVAAAGPGADR